MWRSKSITSWRKLRRPWRVGGWGAVGWGLTGAASFQILLQNLNDDGQFLQALHWVLCLKLITLITPKPLLNMTCKVQLSIINDRKHKSPVRTAGRLFFINIFQHSPWWLGFLGEFWLASGFLWKIKSTFKSYISHLHQNYDLKKSICYLAKSKKCPFSITIGG